MIDFSRLIINVSTFAGLRSNQPVGYLDNRMRVSLADLGVPGRITDQPVRSPSGAAPTDATATASPANVGPAPATSLIQSFTSCSTPLAPGYAWATPLDSAYWADCGAQVFNAANTAPAAPATSLIQSFTNCSTPLAPGYAWATPSDAADWADCSTTGAAASSVPAGTTTATVSSLNGFPAVGYIDPQGNLWQLGASLQIGGTDATNLGSLSAASLTSTASQTLSAALSGNTSSQNGYLLLNSTAFAAVESAYGIGGLAGISTTDWLLIAAGVAAIFLASRH